MPSTRQIHFMRRPRGLPVAEDFALVFADLPEIREGEVQVDTLIMSVDPYMRPRLDADEPLGSPLLGRGIGRIARSRNTAFKEGDIVRHAAGFQESFVSDGQQLTLPNPDPALPLSVYLHALGAPGLTAYGGLLRTGALQPGEQVFVSAAAGAVGSVAAQIAKINGCRVVGSTGSDKKAAWLRDELRLDAVINYNSQPLADALMQATPQGIDVYFENVGGHHLDSALARMNVRGRIPVCGMISTYNGGGAGVHDLFKLVYRRVRMEGFVVTDFVDLNDAFVDDMTGWLKDGRMTYQETILKGFERGPEGLIGLFSGRNIGKMLIHVAD